MAPSRKPSNLAPRAHATPYETRSRRTQDAGSSNDVSNGGIIKNEGNASDGDSSPTYANARRSRTKVTKEFCTAQQSEALLAFFWRYKGYPDGHQVSKFAATIGKSAHSVRVWMSNHRHPRRIENTPWFNVTGAIDPEIDPSAPYYPYNPNKRPFDRNTDRLEVAVSTLDADPNQSTAQVASAKPLRAGSKKGRKAKASRAKPSSRRASPSEPFEGLGDTSAGTSSTGSPPLVIQNSRLTVHASATPESSCSSGDSNGSSASSPRSSPPALACTKQPPTQTELWVAEIMLEMRYLKVQSRQPVQATTIKKPCIKQFDRDCSDQRPSSGPIRTQHSSGGCPRNDTKMHAWHVANPYGRLYPAAKQGFKTDKVVRFVGLEDSENSLRRTPVSQERLVNKARCLVDEVPSRALSNASQPFYSPSQVLGAPKITQMPLPCDYLPALPLDPTTYCSGNQMPHVDGPLTLPYALDSTPAPYQERASDTGSCEDLAFAPYVPFDIARYQSSGHRGFISPDKGDMTEEEDTGAVAPLCSFPRDTHGPCRLSRDIARPLRW